ncbi:MAG: beta-galactosidase [Anaerolineales bacterium]
MQFGVCYYPEHWPEARWADDARWLKEIGITIVRMAEFAWSRMEPEENRFEFAWLDRAVELFAREGFQIVLGTPTAAPPVWLSKNYPDTLPVDEQGRRRNIGGRRHYCPNNPAYRKHTQRIVAAMGDRYGHSSHVIGWQIDNEFGGGSTARCYCPVCEEHFRAWLKKRYENLKAVNEAWGTVFWSAEFDDWSQIGAPILNLATPNPSHVLDYYRFSSDSVVEYEKFQVELLKSTVNRKQWVTHNFIGLYVHLNYFDLAKPLDFVTWDSYPTGNAYRWREILYGPDKPDAEYAWDVGDPAITGFAHALTRGLLGKPFWIMEQGAGHINWAEVNHVIRPGTPRLWAWHAAASGADTIVYFRERAAWYAQEQYHSGLQHHDGSPDVGYFDQQRLWAERESLRGLTTEPPRAEAALMWSYDDLWALQLQPHTKDFTYLRHLFVYYRALQRLGIRVDVVPPSAPLTNYKLLITPSAHLADQPLARRLQDFVRKGGALVMGVRSGFKNTNSAVTGQPLPGVFRELMQATVTDWGALPAGVSVEIESSIPGLGGQAGTWIEALSTPPEAEGARVRATYLSGPYAGKAAMTSNAIGKGRAWYVGWLPTVEQAMAIIQHRIQRVNVTRLAELPPGLIAALRGTSLVLMNFTDETLSATVQGRSIVVASRDVVVTHYH